ncbi:MAG: hypothetical protein LBI08_01280 [Methanomassiliicoccaceae archaeon]|jgi:hypothetical protein|nr:hypothetical protein [Methanomassiliicoccaceae archaeon]
MIEFTMARVCMSVCGLVLLAAVIVPVTGMYESRTVSMESGVSEDIARMVDRFYYSDQDEVTVSMNDILPGVASYVEFKGHMVILTTDRGVYKSGTNVTVISEDTFGYGDIVRFTKSGNSVVAERLT